MLFAVLHKHGPAECPAVNSQQLKTFADAISDKSASSFNCNILQQFVDMNCNGTVQAHLFGAPIHHAILLVESEKKENVQKFVGSIPCEVVGVRALSEILQSK